MLCFAGATMPYCLSLLSAMTVIGTGIFNLALRSSCPKTARICSIRSATSRPRLSPASVSTEKCAECTSIHLGSSLANDRREKQPAMSRLKTTVPIPILRFTVESFPENASTPGNEHVATTTAKKRSPHLVSHVSDTTSLLADTPEPCQRIQILYPNQSRRGST